MSTVLLINGSPHANGNTAAALRIVERELTKRGVQCEWFHIGSKPVRGCIDCQHCQETHRCAFDDDPCNRLIEALLRADGVIVGSPVYFSAPNGALCALLDRAFYATANFGQKLKGKPAAAVVTCWRAGSTSALDRLNRYFSFSQMPIVNGDYWADYQGKEDDFGANTLLLLGKNMASLLAQLAKPTV